jgi:Na+-translocating ferredoxin:NAD+ oxidoreductase subunit B
MMGPPICDELMALVQHLFTEEEAGVARHLGMFCGHTAADLARKEHRPVEQVEPIVKRLADEKRIIAASGPPGDRRYRLMPIMPGIFEMTLISHSPETLSDWHLRFIELFETLYETGYSLDYQVHPTPMVRYLPVGKVIDAHPMALPTDKLEVVLDQFEVFGVGHCQCRMTAAALGHGCGKPLENCTVMGQWAARGIEEGTLRQISKKDAIEIKREAESHRLVNWMMNVQSTKGQCSCSCCGCCCHAMRIVNEFNAPGFIAPPHFVPKLEAAKCISCGKCAKTCPMGAITVDTLHKTYNYRRERCIGCGLCVLACDVQHALAMEPVSDYRLPYRSWFSLLAHAAPGMLTTSWKVWRQRR